MNKQIYFILLTGIASHCFAAESSDDRRKPQSPDTGKNEPVLIARKGSLLYLPQNKVMKAALKADAKGDFTTHEFSVEGAPTPVISYFDLHQDQAIVESALTKTQAGCYDLRPLETRLRSLAIATQPFPKRYRGVLGLFAGLVVGGAAAYEALTLKENVEYQHFLLSQQNKRINNND